MYVSVSGNNSGSPELSASTDQAAAKESTSDPPPIPSGSTEVAPSSTAASVTISRPSTAPMMFVGRVSSAPTELLAGASQVVAQAPTPLTAVSDPTGATQLILKPAASPGFTPQDAPSPDSSTASGVDSTQEKVQCLCDVCLTL